MHGKGLRNLWFQNDHGPGLRKSACILKANILFVRSEPKRKEAVLATKLVSHLTSPDIEVIPPMMKWRPRDFSRVSTGDSDILSSCDMNDEHA